MIKLIKNKRGASLIEVIAAITIASTVLIMIYNIFSFNIRQNQLNRERIMNANIASGIINYFIGQDFAEINSYLGEENYVIIDSNNCHELFSDNCISVLSPLINNKQYSSDNLYVYILPYHGPNELNKLKRKSDIEDFIENADSLVTPPQEDILSVIVVVESSISSRYDFILRGVITDDKK